VPLTLLLARTYLRYAVVVTLLSALAFTPLLYLVTRVPVPADINQAHGVVRTAWLLVGCALVPLLVLVGGVAPAVRSIAEGAPASQLAALRGGLAGLVRSVVPCAIAVCAVAIGAIALAIPGLVLFVLLALTGAQTGRGRGLSAALADSMAAVRPQFAAVAIVIVVSVLVACGGVFALQLHLPVPLPKTPTIDLMANFRLFALYAVVGVTLVAPLPAIALAALATRAHPSA